jgi:hypothetical protein
MGLFLKELTQVAPCLVLYTLPLALRKIVTQINQIFPSKLSTFTTTIKWTQSNYLTINALRHDI